MAIPINWHGQNKELVAPKGREDVQSIKVFNNNKVSVSCWLLTDEEVAEIIDKRVIFVGVLGGPSSYPVFIGSEEAVRQVTADYGKVWAREK